jgi:hypothetical protein
MEIREITPFFISFVAFLEVAFYTINILQKKF